MYDLLNFLFWNGPTKRWDVTHPTSEALEHGYVVKMDEYIILTPAGYKAIYKFKYDLINPHSLGEEINYN